MGMLDYRAHKLNWLLRLPFDLAARALFWLLVIGTIIFAQSLS